MTVAVRKKKKRTKSQRVRQAIQTLGPEAAVKRIQAYLANKRVTVSVALISKIKYGRSESPKNGHSAGELDMGNLMAAKVFAAKVGSVQEARKTIEALAKLTC